MYEHVFSNLSNENDKFIKEYNFPKFIFELEIH